MMIMAIMIIKMQKRKEAGEKQIPPTCDGQLPQKWQEEQLDPHGEFTSYPRSVKNTVDCITISLVHNAKTEHGVH